MRCKDQVVVITGASMGIGEALARAFLAEGARVALSSRDLGRLEEARARIGFPERTLAITCDVRRREDIDALIRSAIDHFGKIDVWINNAGYGLLDSVMSMSMDECRSLFQTNLFGAIECIRPSLQSCRRRKVAPLSMCPASLGIYRYRKWGPTRRANML